VEKIKAGAAQQKAQADQVKTVMDVKAAAAKHQMEMQKMHAQQHMAGQKMAMDQHLAKAADGKRVQADGHGAGGRAGGHNRSCRVRKGRSGWQR
jgi:NOL1/NOP2/fmu family ribosome biogenesis protein